jgi:hypothetical protein
LTIVCSASTDPQISQPELCWPEFSTKRRDFDFIAPIIIVFSRSLTFLWFEVSSLPDGDNRIKDLAYNSKANGIVE